MEQCIDEVEDVVDCIESSIRGYKILDGDGETIILRSEKTGCDFEIVIRRIEPNGN